MELYRKNVKIEAEFVTLFLRPIFEMFFALFWLAIMNRVEYVPQTLMRP